MRTPPRIEAPLWLLPALSGMLLLSGICALVYQVLWLRLLALTFGVTIHAAATVLSSFMGGLALGSLFAGRLADRVKNPLLLFGLVELSIGFCAFVSPWALGAMQRGVLAASPHLPDSTALVLLLRIVLSSAVLLVPTALMGATMPVVVKSSLARLDGLGSRIGLLYAANTAGAIVGSLLAGFYLIPRAGLTNSFLIGASMNAAAGLSALAFSRLVPASAASSTNGREAGPTPDRQSSPGGAVSTGAARTVLAVSAISGFASLALEVVWFRVLAIFLGSTSYTFTIILATVLGGIAIGSALAAPALRWRRLDWLQALAALQFAGAALVLCSFDGLLAVGAPPALLQRVMAALGVDFALPMAAMSLRVVLPASLFFGLAFPIGLRLWTEAGAGEGETGRRVGVFYSVNVGGGILGSLAAGFILLPLLGSRGSLLALAMMYLAAGAALQAACARRRPFMTGLTVSALVAFALQTSLVPNPLDLAHRRIYVGRPVIWSDEGTQTTVAVVGTVGNRTLYLDGHHQANDSAPMAFIHRRIGLLPAVLHAQPKRALVVGLGGGASAGGLSLYPGLAVDVVELSAGVVQAASYLGHINFEVLKNPNVRVRLDDGRNYLQRARVPYDVITADAIPPRHAGANNLNSVEYFRLVRRALSPNGLALHWNGGVSDAEYKLILGAFFAAFPNATLWADGSLMVGSMQPLTVSRRRIDAMLADPGTRRLLALMNVETPEHLVRMFRAGPQDIRAYLNDTPPLSDDRPLLEYFWSLPQETRNLDALPRRDSSVITP